MILAVLLLVPSWTGEERLPLYDGTPVVRSRPVALDSAGTTRVGRLTYLGGLHLTSSDRAFGGYSSLITDGTRFELLSDGGLWFAFQLDAALRPSRPRFGALPGGPGTGWRKLDRDSEAQAIDPATGRMWVAFERANAIWRYTPGFGAIDGVVRPPAMRRWSRNSGPETMVRLRSGAFVVVGEGDWSRRLGGWTGLYFPGDPVAGARPFRFALAAPPGYKAVDAAELPDGDLLVLLRRATLAEGFASKLVRVRRAAIMSDARVEGEEIATLAAPLVHDNFEGIAVTREGVATIVWLVSDDNNAPLLQRTLLLKFRLAP